MLVRLARWIGVALSLAIGPLCAASHAQTEIVGGPGGGHFDDRCPDSAFLVGVETTSGKDLSLITPVCRAFSNGHWVGPAFNLRSWGTTPVGSNGFFTLDKATYPNTCPNDTAVEGMEIEVSRVNLVHDVKLRCRNPNAHDYVMTSYSPTDAGGEAAYDKLVDCGGGALANGLVGRYGSLVDALGLSCQAIALAPPPPPVMSNAGAPIRQTGRPSTPPPVMSNAGAPIKQTGRPSTPAPPPPPAVPNLPPESTSPAVSSLPGYAGIWSVTTVQNAQYEMVLRVDGDVLTGEFKNLQNDIYSGTLTGKLVTDRASISWIQPRNLDSAGQPSQGTGTIKVHTDNTLGGGITYQAPGAAQASYYRWYGTLVRALPVVKHPANPAPNPGVDPGANPGANPGARPGPISNPDASPTRRTFTQANVQRGSRVYRSRSGSDQPENAACEVRRGEIVNVDGVGPDKWVHLANIQNRDCNGQAGWVWNDGDLSMRER